MRRVVVIFLILLFPLNVLAVSASFAAMRTAGPVQGLACAGVQADGALASADAVEQGAIGDPDPDEPPSGADIHDVLHPSRAPAWLPPERAALAHPPRGPGVAPRPPLTPPPVR